ncbi:conserved hypothetical protein [Candidatus Sulfopaludibacter sp. SbA4]|nr:conserved hypothetical protein [Candidatus Sulfopaludibacter sp. SbA4]
MIQPAHPTEEQFARFRSRSLAPLELLEVSDHIAACGECRGRLFEEEHAAAQLRSLRAELSTHLEYEQIAAAAEGSVPPGVERHLADCATCRAEVEDLRQFGRDLKSTPRAPIQMPARKVSWRLPVAAAAAIVLVAAGVGFRYLHSPAPHTEVAATKPAEPPLSADQNAAVAMAMDTHRLERSPILDRVISRRGVLLGAPSATGTFDLIAPLGTAVIADRPVFRWSPFSGASHYVVAIFDENFNQVSASPPVTATEWQPDRPLPRGRIYIWQVSATVGRKTVNAPVPPAPEARFQVVPPEVAAQVESARREHPANHLLLAVLCAKAGALDDAAVELDGLAASDPAAAASLRQSLAGMRQR